MEMNKNLFSALKLEKVIMFIIGVLIVLVAAFGIVSILIMVVMEKNRDIAILKSMGATSQSIMKIFMIDGLIIGVVGTIAGCLAGFALAANLENLANLIGRLLGLKVFPSEIYYLEKIPCHLNPLDLFCIIFATILITLLATLYPSLRASRLDPVEAIRYE